MSYSVDKLRKHDEELVRLNMLRCLRHAGVLILALLTLIGLYFGILFLLG